MSALFDHKITEHLHESARSLVYRARAANAGKHIAFDGFLFFGGQRQGAGDFG